MTVQRDAVVKQLADVRPLGNEEGLIPQFGVLINNLPAQFWNLFTVRLMAAAEGARKADMEQALTDCAHQCGYNTGFGIVNSNEFQSVVGPMVTEGAKDVLRGAYAVFTAWGWAKSGIVQIKEGERMVVRAFDYYEADEKPGFLMGYMIRGVSAAFFDIAYGGQYPEGVNAFDCEQTKGIEVGDPFGEFVVTKK